MRKAGVLVLVAAALAGPLCVNAAQGGWDKVAGPEGCWVYAVFSGYDTYAPRLQSAAGRLGPDVAQGITQLPLMLRQVINEQLGVPADIVDMSRPIGVALFNPMMGQAPIAAVVPLAAGAQAPAGMKVVNGYAVASQSDMLADQLGAAFSGAGGIEGPPGIVRLYVDWGTMFSMFGPLAQMQAASAMQQIPGGNAQAGIAVMDILFSLMGQVENFTLELDVTAQDILAKSDVSVKPGTDLATLCANQTTGTALGNMLAPGSVSVNGKLTGFSGWALKLSERFIGKLIPDPKEADTLRDAVTKIMGKMADEFAVNYAFTPQGIAAEGVVAFTGTRQDVKDYFKLMTGESMPASLKKLMAQGDMEVKYELAEGVRQVDDVQVDRLTTTFVTGPNTDPNVMEQLQNIWGSDRISTESALVGGKWLFSMGGENAPQRMDALIAGAKNPLPGAPAKAPVTMTVDVLKIAGWAMQQFGHVQPPSEFTQGGAPMTGTVTFSGRTVTKSFAMPLETIEKIKKGAEKMDQGGGGAAPLGQSGNF